MRVYFHCLEPHEFTKVFRLENESYTLKDLIALFVAAYNKKFSADALDHGAVSASLASGKELAATQRVTDLTDRSDVYIKPLPGPPPSGRQTISSKGAPAERSRAPQEQQHTQQQQAAEGSKPGALEPGIRSGTRGKAAATAAVGPSTSSLQPHTERVTSHEAPRRTAQACLQVLAYTPGHPVASKQLCQLLLAAERPDNALEAILPAAKLHPADNEVQTLLGDCYLERGDVEKALQAYQAGLESSPQGPGLGLGLGPVDLRLRCARALYLQGGVAADAAAQLVMDALAEEEGHPQALLQYAQIAADRGMWPDCVRVVLRLLVQAPDDKAVKALLAKAVQTPAGWSALVTELQPNPDAHAAYAFLASGTKDNGAIAETIRLYRMALAAEPCHSSYALNLAHTLEVGQDLSGVVRVVEDFIKAAREAGSDLQQLGPLHLQAVQAVLQDGHELELSPGGPPCCLTSQPWQLTAVTETTAACLAAASAASAEGPASSSGSSSCCTTLDYGPQELDALALLFTAVKALFVAGVLEHAAVLCTLLAPAKAAGRTPLHETLIRNEAAYYGCIQQLLALCPTHPMVASEDLKPLYLLGDSHCLPGAWRVVRLGGEQRLLHPLLVTGVKMWHLRPGSSFYPKVHFWNTVGLLSPGAQVILLVGEIDCREGLLTAVDKLKYDKLEDAIDAVLDAWMDVLEELIQDHGLELFIHPIPPVLEATRTIVKLFQGRYQQRVLEATAAGDPAAGKLHWLDFFDHLLTADGAALKAELSLDGTHLSPSYLVHLQAALDAAT